MLSKSLFKSFPETARLWVFALNGPIEGTDSFRTNLETFVSSWKAHGSPLKAGVEIIENQMVLVAADEQSASASGCSIDALTREVIKLSKVSGLSICGGGDVAFKQGDIWQAVSRAEFQKLIASGAVTKETLVVDATLTSIGELHSKGVVKPLNESWHLNAFKF